MHIEKYNNNGIDYLRLVEGKRMRAPSLSSRLSHMSPPNHAWTS